MSIHVYGSNRLEDLAGVMSDVMYEKRPEDPFQEIPVIIHSSGMARWLSQEIAKSANLGLSANIDLIFPGKFFQKWVFEPMDRFSGITADSALKTEELPFNPETIKLLIMKALWDGLEKSEAFSSVNNYLGDGDDIEIRRYQISGRVARLFDRYMNYRPEMLKNWQDGKSTKTEEWQRDLWNSLIKSSGLAKSYSNYFWDFMNHHSPSNVLEDLRRHKAVYVFGLSAMPPAHLAILQKISEFVPVHFFWMNPCKGLWDQTKSEKEMEKEIKKIRGKDIFRRCEDLAKSMEELVRGEAGNPLLGSLGRVGRELHRLLLNCDGVEECSELPLRKHRGVKDEIGTNPRKDIKTATRGVGVAPTKVNDTPQDLLHWLQDDILNNRPMVPKKIELVSGDDSIGIHNCYGPLREAEALREFLIRSFNTDETLFPKDIVVYVPDMELYAPAIEAVFGGDNTYLKKAIPFTIADRTLTREYPSCAAFLAIIKLLGSRFKASEVLSIWSFQEVRDMAGISDDDWDVLQRLLRDARLAWGIDEAFRETNSGCRFRQNSWRFALDRLIFGAVMMESGDDAVPKCFTPRKAGESDTEMPIAPLEDAESYSRLIGSVADWMECLFSIQKTIEEGKVRKSSEWLEVLEEISMRFLPASSGDDGVLAVRRTLGSMRKQLENAELLDMEISWDLAAIWIRERIEGEASDEKFCCGMLTFCRFQPMRGIPSSIVCMLGMNDGLFPRQDKRLGFDLMDPNDRLVCDRWGKDDDRYAFLEAIVSARKKLYISYTGRRDTDKQEMPPSILVSELLSYLGSRINADKAKLESTITIQHPLHPFSQDYFTDGNTGLPRSSSNSWCNVAKKLYGKMPDMMEQNENNSVDGTAEIEDAEKRQKTASDTVLPSVTVKELLQFFDSPCKHYYEKVVGIDLNIQITEQPKDDEPSDLGNLDGYHVRTRIYDAYKKLKLSAGCACDMNQLKKELLSRTQAEGILPYGAAGRKIFDCLWDETEEWIMDLEKLGEESGELLPPLKGEIDMDIAGSKINLSYEICDLRKNCQLIARPATLKTKNSLQMAVQQAILQVMTGRGASGLPEKSVFLGLGGQEEQGTLQEPDEYLRNLLGIYLDGQKRPVCFWLEAAAKGMSLDGFSEKDAKAEWEPGFKESLAYKKPDEYTKMVFGEKMPTGKNLEEFQELAKKVIVFGLKQKKKVNPKKEVADASASTEKIKIPHKRGKNIGGSK